MNVKEKPAPVGMDRKAGGRNKTVYKNNHTTSQVSFNKILPENPEAEIAVLEAIFAGPQGIKMARKFLNPEDFSRTAGRDIFRRMCGFDDAGRAFNITAIDQSFEEDPNYLTYSNALSSLYPITTSVIDHFAKIVLENSLRCKLIAITEKVNSDSFHQSIPLLELVDKLESVCADVRQWSEVIE